MWCFCQRISHNLLLQWSGLQVFTLICLIWCLAMSYMNTLICLIWYLDMPWCAFNTWCLDMSYMNTLIYLIWCLEMPWCAFNIWCLESRPLICLICTPWYALYGALRACQWRVRSQLSHSLLSSCLGFNQCQYCLSIFPIVIFLHSNESCFSLLLSSIISFTRGEVGVSSSAFPFTLHRFRVHRDQEAKIFRHSVQQVPSQTLNKLESGDQLLMGTGDNYTDTVISMESFATHVKEEALKFWSFEALKLWGFEALKLWGFEALNLWGFEALKLWSFEALKLTLPSRGHHPSRRPHRGQPGTPTGQASPVNWNYITRQLKLYTYHWL